MTQYISDPTSQSHYIYDLCSVINHIGQSLYLGHYTAFARTHDKIDSSHDELGWRLFDDAHVQPVSNLEHLVTQDAYVLVYRLRTKENIECSPEQVDMTGNVGESVPNLNESSGSTSEDEYFNLNSDESEDLNSFIEELNNASSSESLNIGQVDVNKAAFTNLNDTD